METHEPTMMTGPTEMVEVGPPKNVSGFEVMDPRRALDMMTEWANVLAEVVKRRPDLVANINGKKYPTYEVWTTLGKFAGVFSDVKWTKETESDDPNYCEMTARCELHTLDGRYVCGAEASCDSDETSGRGRYRWRDGQKAEGRPTRHAIRSMAQTRAIAKAYRMDFSSVLVLAGMAPTPAEEMPVTGQETAPVAPSEDSVELVILSEKDLAFKLDQIDNDDNYRATEPDKRAIIWTIANLMTDGDTQMAESFVQKWSSFTNKEGREFSATLAQTRKDGTLSLRDKWLNATYGRATEDYREWQTPVEEGDES